MTRRRKKQKSPGPLQQFPDTDQRPLEIKEEGYSQIVAQQFQGPLPPPALLKQYEENFPGAAERIFKMAEKQAEHRQTLEKNWLMRI